ncbi:MAG: hypothetical protein R6X06_01170 [Gammaproteobacteria bacterium]
MGLLDELRQQADSIRDSEENQKARAAQLEAWSRAQVRPKLTQIYTYLNELISHLEVVQPDTPVAYPLKGYGTLENLVQANYKLTTDSREDMRRVTLAFSCEAKGTVSFNVEGKPQVERLRELLMVCKLAFTSREYRDDRHNLVSAQFNVEAKVPVLFNFELAENKTTINLTIRNFEGLGTHVYRLQPEMIDEQLLDQMGLYILRADNHFLRLDMSEEERDRLRQRLSGEQGVVETTAPAEDQQEPVREAPAVKKLFKKKTAARAAARTSVMTPAATPQVTDKPAEPVMPSPPVTEPPPEQAARKSVPAAAPTAKADYNKAVLDFPGLPTPYKEVDRQLLDSRNYLLGLDGLDDFPDRFFQTTNSMLSLLNHTILKPEKRLELVEAMLHKVCPLFVAMYNQYQAQEHCLPENRMRRTILTAAATAAGLFATAYTQVFVAMYSLALSERQAPHDNLALSGFRLLELVRIQQRLKALRYEKLMAENWLVLNKVFFVLLERKLTEVDLPLAGGLGLPVRQTPASAMNSCAQKLFYSLHVFGLFEVTTWPMRFFNVPDAYLLQLNYPFKVLPDRGKPLLPGWMVVAESQDSPAQLARRRNYAGAALLIEYSGLYNRLVADHEQLSRAQFLGKSTDASLSSPLAVLNEAERIPVLELMIFNLRHRERHQKRHIVTRQELFRVCFGYQESQHVLREQNNKDLSSLMKWRLLNFSTGGLLLAAEESDVQPIKLGQLVCFAPDDKAQEPLLGYISRLQRAQDSRVEIAVVRISSYVENIEIKDLSRPEETGLLPALLIQDLDNAWKLVVHHSYAYVSGTPLQICRHHGPLLPARLGDVWLRKSEFSVFELSSPGLDSRG